MTLPTELQTSPPRKLNNANVLFKSKVKTGMGLLNFILPLVWIPVIGAFGHFKYDALQGGLIWGAVAAAFVELWAIGRLVSARKAPALFEFGVATFGTIQHISKNTNMTVIKLSYKEKLGMELEGHAMVTEMDEAGSNLLKGDLVPILYQDNKPSVFMLYSDSVISNVGIASPLVGEIAGT